MLPRPSDWMTVVRLDAFLAVGGGGWLAAGSWAYCSYARGFSWNPGMCSMYCSGTRGMPRNPVPCSMKCSDRILMYQGLSVGDVGVRRLGVACEVALPQGALSRVPRNYLSGVWGGLLWEQYFPLDVPTSMWKTLCDETRRFSLGYLCHDLVWKRTA